jgi:hypothetical protein
MAPQLNNLEGNPSEMHFGVFWNFTGQARIAEAHNPSEVEKME